MGAAETRCFHCGEPVPNDSKITVSYNDESQPVCCTGCEAVFNLISSAGLDRYYRFRQEVGRKATDDLEANRQAWQAVDDRESFWGTPTPEGRRDLLLQVQGIKCAACAWLIRSQLERSSGVHSVQVDIATGYTNICWEPERIRLSKIAMTLFELGYVPHLPIASVEEQGRRKEQRDSLKRLGIAGLGMMQVMMYAVGLYAGDSQGISPAARGFLTWVSLLVTLPVLLYSGRVFFIGAWHSISSGRPGMDVPVSLAIGLAFIASCFNFFRGSGEVWFDSVVMFIFFLSLGRYVELILRHRNLQAGTALARLMPEWAQRITLTGSVERIPSGDVSKGDQVRVPPGEAFPADGIIISGTSHVDESLLTGESMAHVRGKGDKIVAGTMNLNQSVDIKVTASGDDSTISALGRMVLAAQTRSVSNLGMPSWLIPGFIVTVLVLAGATWLFWQQVQPEQAFSATLAVLVASCPCALSLALPAVYSAASHSMMTEGMLLTRGDALHELMRVDTVVFDKTGTLTLGQPTISRLTLNPERPEHTKDTVMNLSAAMEAHSNHPVARAFAHADFELPAQDVRFTQSGGLAGTVGEQLYYLGSPDFISEATGQASEPDTKGDVFLADGQSWLACFSLSDQLRDGIVPALTQLADRGLDVHMVSGDGEAAVRRVAGQLGIDSWSANQKPEQKLLAIKALQDQGRVVLMVGDGANDGPVLAAADVSMTVQGATELANSTADVILTSESMELLSRVFEIAASARSLIRQNLSWALIYNASVMPLAMTGMLKPWMAALGMSASSLLVVLNASRLSASRNRSESPVPNQA